MLKQSSKNFRKQFILEFTKELIRSTQTYRDLRIKKEVKIILHRKHAKPVIRKDVKEVIKEKMHKDSEKITELKQEEEIFGELKTPLPVRRPLPVLRIPESQLPPTVSYLRPFPTTSEIELENLNPLIKDPLVKVIECNGPNEKIMVMGAMGRKSTGIILNQQQISEIIQKFSQAAKIPVHEGILKVVFGKLILSAIVSDIIGSKFIIRKMV